MKSWRSCVENWLNSFGMSATSIFAIIAPTQILHSPPVFAVPPPFSASSLKRMARSWNRLSERESVSVQVLDGKFAESTECFKRGLHDFCTPVFQVGVEFFDILDINVDVAFKRTPLAGCCFPFPYLEVDPGIVPFFATNYNGSGAEVTPTG